jgi:hypothetical protein
MKTTILLTIEHDSPIPDLTDLIALRVYTIVKESNQKVIDVTAEVV